MRQRTLKPGFYKNEDLAARSAHARLLFGGLLLLADRAGRLEDRPLRIRAEVFPYEGSLDVEAMLQELEGAGFLLRYEVGGCRYIAIPTFAKHQHPHPKEPQSVIPAPVKGNGLDGNGRGQTMADRAGSSGPSGPSGPSEHVAPPASNGALSMDGLEPPETATPEEARAYAQAVLGKPTSAERKQYAEEVWTAFCRRRGSDRPDMSPADWHVLSGWMDRRVPLRLVLRGIQDCGGDPPTLRYVKPAVEEAVRRGQEALRL